MFDMIRRYAGRLRTSASARPEGGRERRPHNLFEAAAVYVAARAEDDQDRIEEAAAWVSPEALSFGVSELACRAVIALARERDESPDAVARDLLGLPAA
ncbi:hypothetical protein QR97_20630 [Streptomyces sp. PBH53]|uniref:Uncharacterized protein n=3 Tax=Streptomyces TaxID=1883 RepID=A0ABS9JCS4_9ACTN|nr:MULTISPECIES: hypothetical protein [Streptomyces]MYU27937.1 hypothetical protein [Streptomyces sp. SID7810]CUW26809.1 hypothetical protein TUE45_01522 [Streptomyces reticuli]AKN75450.1 hypothetical protein QR97_20630 [Streptomyces sp. PBH53]MCE0444573.1 hypothetical protein [Streptomyces tricolor]MCG0063355.1 hypothetical protein [Streptomyces tricolor]